MEYEWKYAKMQVSYGDLGKFEFLENKRKINIANVRKLVAVLSDILPTLKCEASKGKTDGTQELPNVVPASMTPAFKEGLTVSPQALLGSDKPCPTIKILIEAFKSR
jgi:hypothetical protein